jgi:putative ABC transport system permease protein
MSNQPGVRSAGGGYYIPLSGRPIQSRSFEIEGRAPTSCLLQNANLNTVTSGYFETMNVPLLRGRFISSADRAGQPSVAVVNETMARRFFPGEEALGKRIIFTGIGVETQWMEIVGVVSDSKYASLDEDHEPELYISVGQTEQLGVSVGAPALTMSLLVKANDGISPEQFRSVVREIDPNARVFDVEPVEGYIDRVLARPKLVLMLLGVFAAVALLLASVGVYGLISYSVSQRTREMGIRMALGARRSSIIKLIAKQGTMLAVIGVICGLVMSFALTHVLQSQLYGVTATDPATFTVVPLLLIAVALLASYVPARRATRVDPMRALRTE